MGSLKIIKPGLLTSVQDLGRAGLGYYAIPTSGVMDKKSAQLANLIVGNELGLPLIECTMVVPIIEFLTDAIIALTGANASWKINEKQAQIGRVLFIKKGDILSGKRMTNGLRAYIAIKGKLNAQYVYGSASYYLNGGIGGHNGRHFQKEDIITWEDDKSEISFIKVKSKLKNLGKIKIHKGPEYNFLNEISKALLIQSTFSLSPNSNRMGARLKGATLNCNSKRLSHSVAAFPGVIQLPQSGEPIVLLNDGQTTGGYPRIAYIDESFLSHFNQISIGGFVQFYFQ